MIGVPSFGGHVPSIALERMKQTPADSNTEHVKRRVFLGTGLLLYEPTPLGD